MMIGELLQKFCDRDGYLKEPFVKDGWRYFTNGSVMIRLPAVGCEDSQQGRQPKKPADILKGIEKIKKWQPWPTGESCSACENSRVVTKKCADCGGRCVCRHCKEGDCPECEGKGEQERTCECAQEISRWHEARISRHYVWLIGQLGKVEWAEPPKGSGHLVFFRWEEGQGAVAKIVAWA